MTQVILNQEGLRLLRRQLESRLTNAVDEAVAATKAVVRVDTGRMQKSVRSEPLVRPSPNLVLTFMVIGGIELYGVYKEQDRKRLVDYAAEVETLYGDVRANISLLIAALREGFAR